MAEFTQTPYLEIIKIAFIPAMLYFFSVILFVHFEAQKNGIWGLPKEQLPNMMDALKNGIHFIIPVAILVTVLLMNYSPMMAGFVAVLAVYFTALLRKSSRISFGTLLKTLEQGARNAITVAVACAAAGIIVGIVNLTGTGLRFSSLIVSLSGGVPLVALFLVAFRPDYSGGARPDGSGAAAADSPHDRFLVFAGCQRHTACGARIFCRFRNSRIQPDEDGVHIVEAGERAVHHSRSDGLSSAAA
jgi:hypothetical protein